MVARKAYIYVVLIAGLLFGGYVSECFAIEAKKIRFSITMAYAPYHFHKKDGTSSGIQYEILKNIAQKHGYSVEMVPIPRKRMEKRILAGEEDVFANALKWTKDIEKYVYTDAVTPVRDVIFYRKDRAIKFTKPEDLIGKSLVAIRGFNYPMLEPLFKSGKIVRHDTADDSAALKMVKAGRGDGALVLDVVGHWLIKENNWDGTFGYTKKAVNDTNFRFIFNKKWAKFVPKFNAELKAMRADGRYEAILKRYKK